MAKLPDVDHIRDALEAEINVTPLRPYLGMSSLGHHCSRYLWYYFHLCHDQKISKQLQRIFDRGNMEEPRVVFDLEEAGMVVTGCLDNQKEYKDPTGHIRGHSDGIVNNVPGAEKTTHLLEIKTANEKKFREFTRFGVKRSNPQYYCQIVQYMDDEKLTRTLYVITNKNNEERYYERIDADPVAAQQLKERGEFIITTPTPPERISTQPEWHQCRMCDAADVCWGREPALPSCRTCSHVVMQMEGKWSCGLTKEDLPVKMQRIGCELRDPIVVI